MNDNITPSIYVACLAAYNNAYLHGCWIDATQDIKVIYKKIEAMLANSPMPCAEEWAIHDYENFGALKIEEYSSIESVCATAHFLKEYGNLGAAAATHYSDIESATEALNNDYHGEWDSETNFAEHLFDELYAHNLPQEIQYYIDYEKFSHDLFINDYIAIESDNKVHVFTQS